MNINKYLSEDEIKRILEDEIRQSVRKHFEDSLFQRYQSLVDENVDKFKVELNKRSAEVLKEASKGYFKSLKKLWTKRI